MAATTLRDVVMPIYEYATGKVMTDQKSTIVAKILGSFLLQCTCRIKNNFVLNIVVYIWQFVNDYNTYFFSCNFWGFEFGSGIFSA